LVLADELRPQALAQGDIVEDVEFYAPRNGTYQPTVHAPGVITSHSCDFTKFAKAREKGRPVDRWPLLVAPLVKASEMDDKGIVGHARRDRVARYLFLPAEPPLSEEHLVDYWFMQPVAVLELLATLRLASMTDEWQRRLQRSLDRFFSWEDRKKSLDRS
jgi:hypothetical protein